MGGPWRLLARLLLTPPLLVLCVLKVESGEPAEPASTEAEQTVMPTVPRASVHKCVKWGEYVDQGPNSKPLYTYPLKWDATSRNCDVVMASDQKVRDRYRQWEWTIPKHVAAECPTSSTQPFKIIRKRYCSALANRSILFLGDSTQRDMFKSAVLLAIAAVNEPEILDANLTLDHDDRLPIKRVTVCRGTAHLAFVRSDRLDVYRYGKLFESLPSVMAPDPFRKPFSNFIANSDEFDAVVLNRGIHVVNDTYLVSGVRELATFLDKEHRRRKRLGKHLDIFWRTTATGHKHCSRFTEPLVYRHVPSSLYGWDKVEHQNELTRSALVEVLGNRVNFVDAFELSNLRPDRHVGYRRRVGSTILDCLHYCLPGPPDDWNALLVTLLDGISKSRRRQAAAGSVLSEV